MKTVLSNCEHELETVREQYNIGKLCTEQTFGNAKKKKLDPPRRSSWQVLLWCWIMYEVGPLGSAKAS